jgi:glucoside 3-dehydrogenase (cytochrome c) hitch-hiker subunit
MGEEPMDDRATVLVSRREAVQRVAALLGGAALAGGDRLFAFSFEPAAIEQAMAHGAGALTAADVALLDEIADTILPETSTPGAKAAKVGAFMALMVSEVYDQRTRQVFQQGLRQLEDACREAHAVPFMQASAAQRLSLVEALDREQHAVMEDRAPKRRVRAPAAAAASDEPAHYFRLMKELTLLGYFTSEIGCTRAMRYIESPGRFDPNAPLAPGDRSWAPHA